MNMNHLATLPQPPLATDNMLENTDGVLRPLLMQWCIGIGF